jgi:hypothetical protein
MDRFDDVSVVASVDESPPPPRVPRRVRHAFAVVVASVVAAGALGGAAVGLASEKPEPARVAAPSGVPTGDGWTSYAPLGRHECHRHQRGSTTSSAPRY